MPLYVSRKTSPARFWDITLSGEDIRLNWGVYGQESKWDSRRFSTALAARAERNRLVAEKVLEGYELAEGEEAPVEDGEDTSHLARRHPELEAAIEKAPDNVEGYLVYGDWLQGQQDPRGEWIALQCAAHPAPALPHESKRFLLGGLADREKDEVTLEWRFGFIQSARLNAGGYYGMNFDVAEAVRLLRALPAARFLRELTLCAMRFEFGEDGHVIESMDYGEVISVLGETPWPTLERLFIGDFDYPGEAEISWAHLWDVSPLYKTFPQLRALRLRGGDVELGEVDLPELREFSVETAGLPLAAVHSIVSAKWPKLERLEVWFGREYHGAAGGDEQDLLPLLDGQGVPNLKHLGLCNASFGHRLSKLLPEAKILRQLESLDLSKGTLTDEEAAELARHAAAFQHLKHLDVSENQMSDEGVAQLATLCASVAVGNQREYFKRYVAVVE